MTESKLLTYHDQLSSVLASLEFADDVNSTGTDLCLELAQSCALELLRKVLADVRAKRGSLSSGEYVSVEFSHTLQRIDEKRFRQVAWQVARQLQNYGYFVTIDFAGSSDGLSYAVRTKEPRWFARLRYYRQLKTKRFAFYGDSDLGDE